MTLIFVFIFGLIIGSFLNAVIFRLDSDGSVVMKRSHCMHCGHELEALDLIPVISFIFLLGRCRYCSRKISWQYPLVEIMTGIIFILLLISYQFQVINLKFIFDLVIVCFLVIIGVFDFKHYLILDRIVIPVLAIVIIRSIFFESILSSLIGACLVAGFFALQYYFSKGRWIGFGDVKFGLVLGVLFGLKMSIVMLIIAYFLGAIAGLTLIFLKRKNLSSQLPFGVFLSISAIIMILYGHHITDWYLKLIGIV